MMVTKRRDASINAISVRAQELEDYAKSEISELFLLLKSGTLTPEQEAVLHKRLGEEIERLKKCYGEDCCGQKAK